MKVKISIVDKMVREKWQHISSKKLLPILLFAFLWFLSFSLFTNFVQAATPQTHIYGKILDGETSQPISGARVLFALRSTRGLSLVTEAKTDAAGNYEVWITSQRSYEVYACWDLPSTEGLDYVPSCQRISPTESSLNVSFILLPGASIQIAGELSLFGTEPLRETFTVFDSYGALNETSCLTEYTRAVNDFLGLNRRTIVVPADMPVKVRADITYKTLEIRLILDKQGDYLNLNQNTQLIVYVRNLIVEAAVNYVRIRLQSVQAMVDDAERKGFYVSYERIRLNRAENLVTAAQSDLSQGNYEEAYADSHETYLILQDLESSLQSMYFNASTSVFFITPFLSVTAVTLAFILSEKPRQRLVLSLLFYAILLGSLYLLYPGYNALQRRIYDLWANAFLSVVTPIVLVTVSFPAAYRIAKISHTHKEKTSMENLRLLSAVASVFSLAARNLMRRRFRTLLTSTLMLISVFSLISLTSLSFEYGFNIQPLHGHAPSEGFLLRKPQIEGIRPFKPMEQNILQWLEGCSEATVMAPMIENLPQIGVDGPPPPLATIYANKSGLSFEISGVMGVFPNSEVTVTKIDTIVVRGLFLSDEEKDGILISEKAAKALQVELNDTLTLYDRNFKIIGIFDCGKLDALKDLDGQPLSPEYVIKWIIPNEPPMYLFYYVAGEDVVIIHGETAQSLEGMVVSRIDVQTKSPQEIDDLARLTVLTWPEVEAYASISGGIKRLFIGSYYTSAGFDSAIVLLLLVVLNVGITIFGAVYERKREVAIMSCLGLNPLHITGVFIAEALVMGIIAGSLGYILGLMSYRFMAIFIVPIGMKQKVEATWGILALCFSITAGIIGSAFPAHKASVITTPSLLRKFKITEEKPRDPSEPWRLNMPVRIRKEDLRIFFTFMNEELQRYITPSIERIENLEVFTEETAEPSCFRISFTYIYSEESVLTENQLYPIKDSLPNQYVIQLASQTRKDAITTRDAHRTAGFVRRLMFQYLLKDRLKDENR